MIRNNMEVIGFINQQLEGLNHRQYYGTMYLNIFDMLILTIS